MKNKNELILEDAVPSFLMNSSKIEFKNYCKCQKCGAEAEVDTTIVFTSVPPCYKYVCKECGYVGYTGHDEDDKRKLEVNNERLSCNI